MNSSDLTVSGATVLRVVVALAPVQIFLLVLLGLDSFRLVRPRRVLLALLAGAVAAGLAYVANNTILAVSGLAALPFALVVAPVVEESLKGAYSLWLVRTRRVGFLVDAALLGFAVGAGFATVENIYYLRTVPDAPALVWAVRGLGTAIMHGGASALMAILLRARRPDGLRGVLLALAAASLFHASFNAVMSHPIPATVALLVVLPAVLLRVYRRGEDHLRRWLGRGFDRDTELLAIIRTGSVRTTPLGRYLASLGEVVPPARVADMLCLLRLQAELSIRAKGTLLLQEQGLVPRPDPDLAARLEEVRWLERSIGRAGLLALDPVSPWRDGRDWQRHLLEQEARRGTESA